jgi:hypothetical protein
MALAEASLFATTYHCDAIARVNAELRPCLAPHFGSRCANGQTLL